MSLFVCVVGNGQDVAYFMQKEVVVATAQTGNKL
jgi:hypothetical protein